MEQINLESVIKSAVILVIGCGLFFGLKGRLLRFAERANLPRLAVGPIRFMVRAGILAVTILWALDVLGMELSRILGALVAVLTMVAIGFVAVWSVLSNVLCTFVLVMAKPFAVGEELDFPGDQIAGKVVDISLIFTTLRNDNNEYMQIPNNMFFQKIFKRRRVGEQPAIGLEEQLQQTKPTL